MQLHSAIKHTMFGEDHIEKVSDERLDELLQEYPYLAQAHWLKAAKNKDNKEALYRAGLYAYYPSILQQHLQETDSSEKTKNDIPAAPADKPAFQPLYTEDYFAYTGTKLPEKIENDKPPTMEQVNSFTGWLKKMKNPAAGKPQEEIQADSTTEAQAEKQGEEVITESMAKIWIENDRPDKAKKIYEKLILLNPEKKSYFAAKINALKEL